MDNDFVVIDIETTGLSAYYHKITEIAALKYSKGKIKDEFVTLINPESPIPRFITQLTGINDLMVKGAPKIKEAIPKFNNFLSDNIFVGHNVGFDYKFLSYASKICTGNEYSNLKICTCRLARRLLPELPSRKLSSLCTHFNIQNQSAHRARGDALATAYIFEQMLAMLAEKQINSVEAILNFQKSKVPKPNPYIQA